jgi:hypothetical protein
MLCLLRITITYRSENTEFHLYMFYFPMFFVKKLIYLLVSGCGYKPHNERLNSDIVRHHNSKYKGHIKSHGHSQVTHIVPYIIECGM